MKYVLTPEAKEAAKIIVAEWDKKSLPQKIIIVLTVGFNYDSYFIIGANQEFKYPPSHAWEELAKYGLLDLRYERDDKWHILLLQELRNAVNNDFEVSEYFHPARSSSEAADFLITLLGQEFLETQTELKETIDELRTATKENQQTTLGKLISQLGNSLQHGSNTATIVTTLYNFSAIIQKMLTG
jgi:hypothetical protein